MYALDPLWPGWAIAVIARPPPATSDAFAVLVVVCDSAGSPQPEPEV